MDLNLLLALDALVAERSVTLAARRMRLTQPAMSRALGRLREHFGDPLLVRAGRGMVLTPRAEALGPPLRQALLGLEAVVAEQPDFDPRRSRRTFTVATADYGMAVLVPPLLGRLGMEAPAVDLTVLPIPADLGGELESGRIDAVIAPKRPSAPGLVWSRLFAERNVCLVRDGHPRVGRTLSLERFCDLLHVFVSPEGRPVSVVDEALERRGLSRRIALRVGSFLVAPLVVAESDLIATTASRIAARFTGPLALRILAPPIDLPEFTLAIGWHERVRRDPGHAWFRALVASVARELA